MQQKNSVPATDELIQKVTWERVRTPQNQGKPATFKELESLLKDDWLKVKINTAKWNRDVEDEEFFETIAIKSGNTLSVLGLAKLVDSSKNGIWIRFEVWSKKYLMHFNKKGEYVLEDFLSKQQFENNGFSKEHSRVAQVEEFHGIKVDIGLWMDVLTISNNKLGSEWTLRMTPMTGWIILYKHEWIKLWKRRKSSSKS